MLKRFNNSVQGKLFEVSFILKVFVKHDSWNEYGEGMVVSFPIQILGQPFEIVSKLEVQAPDGWNPNVAEVVHLTSSDSMPQTPGQ